MLKRLFLSFILLSTSRLVFAQCDETVLAGAYAASGQLSFDEGSRSDQRISIPLTALIVFDGKGMATLEELFIADFDENQYSTPKLERVDGQGAYTVAANCSGTLFLDLSYQGQSAVVAEMEVAFVLTGSGALAEGFKGTINLNDLEDGGGDIGRLEAIQLNLQASAGGSAAAVLNLEEPINQSVASGVSNIRGWAVAQSGIRKLELFINGDYISDIPYGGDRADVGAAFPDIANAGQSGFGQTFNYGLLGSGQHTMTVRAYTNEGGFSEETSTFNIAAFRDPFITEEGFPSLRDASVSLNREIGEILVQNVLLADNSTYDLALQWRKATQGFEIVEVLEFVVD
jgi:hypothetical protein